MILEYAEKLRSGELSSVELTREYISRIEKMNPKINCFVHICFEEALEMAHTADEMLASGNADILCGIPMALKDNICTKGIVTDCCSRILKDYRPNYDATVWAKLRSLGAVLLGKTNMDEFGMGSGSVTGCYGPVHNPLDKNRSAGGSSGGSAAAVAANLACYALGSDTGGSVRLPAAYCGVYGLKPGYGSVSRYGLIAYGSSLEQIGVIAADAKDAAIVYERMAGTDEHDATSCRDCLINSNQQMHYDCLNNKNIIGLAHEITDSAGPAMKSALLNAAENFRKAGAEIVEVGIPHLKEILSAYYIIACAEASSNLGRYDGIRYGLREEGADINDMIVKTRSRGFGSEVKKRIMFGTYVLSGGYADKFYKKACVVRETAKRDFAAAFEKCNMILTPAAVGVAPELSGFTDGKTKNSRLDAYLGDIMTVPANMTGLPAFAFPEGCDENGLPLGLMLTGRKGEEMRLMSVAGVL